MNINDPELQGLVDRVQAACANGTTLCIRGGGSKAFYGEAAQGELLDTRVLAGTSSYEPTELVVTTRCGTPLAELEALLATKGQCLPFEPPHFGAAGTHVGKETAEREATVGGMVAAGLAGPSRAAVGSVRDYVLGATMLNGRGEVLTFGGQVMKNVAGYDVSRLLAGSLGTLGVVLEVSLKVLPVAPATLTLALEMDEATAIASLHARGGQPLPVNASAWWNGSLLVRLSGAVAAVHAAQARIGGEVVSAAAAAAFWEGLRNHHDEYFVKGQAAVQAGAALWRLSVPQTAPPLALHGDVLMEWGGAQRWLCCTLPASAVREATAGVGGHATLFMAQDKSAGVFAPLSAPLARIHRELKKSFDPAGVFNPGRLYPGL
ncbi:MAG: glycolate oxidase subunit GlcE [Rhizobacter sp.]|nr:glycolate oxidase subunit GlcE [Rhizobacter sp.]